MSSGPCFSSSNVSVHLGGSPVRAWALSSPQGQLRIEVQAALYRLIRCRNCAKVTRTFSQIPAFSDLCPNTTSCAGPAGYLPLTVANPPKLTAAQSAVQLWTVNPVATEQTDFFVGGVVSCPPYCPGGLAPRRSGVYITRPCPQFVNGPSCTSRSSAAQCGYYSDVDHACLPCPAGAVCPGGSRVWPVPGNSGAHADCCVC